ncbi:DOMON domain-containing protein frrs1L [Elasticomyces elasticus]|nr:DOMON domain-containing protein frrs1L [Elasticomyces elasticus]KAK5026509.1 hypothetical protein LTS07_007443 [Exophiala sideris]KAK5180044.1 hypothetical protein LTR44_007520 [Eurotiomycetes sp. CCFEE 6388]
MISRRTIVAWYFVTSMLVAISIAQPTYMLTPSDTGNSYTTLTSSSPNLIFHPDLTLPPTFNAARIAHAVLGACAVLIFFPLGGTIMLISRHPNAVYIHATLQTFAYIVFVTAAGLGIWMARKVHARFPRIIHLAKAHLWFGRILITVGIINGGLGFQFASTFPGQRWPPGPRIAYGAIATLVWILYVSVIAAWSELKRNPTFTGVRDETTALTQAQTRRRTPVDTSRPTTGVTQETVESRPTTGNVHDEL